VAHCPAEPDALNIPLIKNLKRNHGRLLQDFRRVLNGSVGSFENPVSGLSVAAGIRTAVLFHLYE
jgi:hypothetical protein